MKDFNFFSVYTKRKTDTTQKTLKVALIIASAAIVIGGAYAGLTYYRGFVDNKAAEIDAYLMSEEVNNNLAAIRQYESTEAIIGQYSQMIGEVLKNLKAGDYINSGRLDEIGAALPQSVAMKSIQVQDRAAVIEFNVPDLVTAAQLVTALSALDCFQSVSLANIDGGDAAAVSYTATVNAVLKGGAAE